MPLPSDYAERVYAGVLGKIIGVYLGRPFEGWTHDRIMAELGEITYYVHQRLGAPLIVTDDDISGTFTFVRALADHGYTRDLSPAQIGQTWLNYLIEKRTILWWGGLGNSSEHTAYLRLKHGIQPPASGAIASNGRIMAEQVGAQIFIDGWAMVAPGDPALAADLARRAASVSHDGEAIHGAQVIAAMEAQAFVERDRAALLDTAVSLIPRDSLIARMIADIREWHARDGNWRTTRDRIAATYGYDRYGGGCHMVPNHALIILALLYGDDDFQKSLMIVNTCGWDTDCNSGNVGCLLGIKNGLAGIDAGPDWRGPVADRLYVAAADGGRVVSDAVTETYHLVTAGRALAGLPPKQPKEGARFHFTLPGSVQGFQPEEGPESSGIASVANALWPDDPERRCLAIRVHHLAPGRAARIATPTFMPADTSGLRTYDLMASPTLYAGQTVRAALAVDAATSAPVACRLYFRSYGASDALDLTAGPALTLAPGQTTTVSWRIPATGGAPIAAIGVEITAATRADGAVYLDYLTWDGAPDVVLDRPATGGTMWRRAWVQGVDDVMPARTAPYRVIQNEGRGLLMQGAREWADYQVRCRLTPHLVTAAGIGIRVQGMRRYYALLLTRGGKARLVKVLEGEQVLAEADLAWEFEQDYDLCLSARGAHLEAWIGDRLLLAADDDAWPLTGGAAALICEEGHLSAGAVTIAPVD
jgi:ADP-ribosylglycohydrolase